MSRSQTLPCRDLMTPLWRTASRDILSGAHLNSGTPLNGSRRREKEISGHLAVYAGKSVATPFNTQFILPINTVTGPRRQATF